MLRNRSKLVFQVEDKKEETPKNDGMVRLDPVYENMFQNPSSGGSVSTKRNLTVGVREKSEEIEIDSETAPVKTDWQPRGDGNIDVQVSSLPETDYKGEIFRRNVNIREVVSRDSSGTRILSIDNQSTPPTQDYAGDTEIINTTSRYDARNLLQSKSIESSLTVADNSRTGSANQNDTYENGRLQERHFTSTLTISSKDPDIRPEDASTRVETTHVDRFLDSKVQNIYHYDQLVTDTKNADGTSTSVSNIVDVTKTSDKEFVKTVTNEERENNVVTRSVQKTITTSDAEGKVILKAHRTVTENGVTTSSTLDIQTGKWVADDKPANQAFNKAVPARSKPQDARMSV